MELPHLHNWTTEARQLYTPEIKLATSNPARAIANKLGLFVSQRDVQALRAQHDSLRANLDRHIDSLQTAAYLDNFGNEKRKEELAHFCAILSKIIRHHSLNDQEMQNYSVYYPEVRQQVQHIGYPGDLVPTAREITLLSRPH